MKLRSAIFACAVFAAPFAHADTADQRFEAIYKAEWTWRQTQFPGRDSEDREAGDTDARLPAVDAKTQGQAPA